MTSDDKEIEVNRLGRAASWWLLSVFMNLLFAEVYFLNSGTNWKFYVSVIISICSFFAFWCCNVVIKELDSIIPQDDLEEPK